MKVRVIVRKCPNCHGNKVNHHKCKKNGLKKVACHKCNDEGLLCKRVPEVTPIKVSLMAACAEYEANGRRTG